MNITQLAGSSGQFMAYYTYETGLLASSDYGNNFYSVLYYHIYSYIIIIFIRQILQTRRTCIA